MLRGGAVARCGSPWNLPSSESVWPLAFFLFYLFQTRDFCGIFPKNDPISIPVKLVLCGEGGVSFRSLGWFPCPGEKPRPHLARMQTPARARGPVTSAGVRAVPAVLNLLSRVTDQAPPHPPHLPSICKENGFHPSPSGAMGWTKGQGGSSSEDNQ